MMKISFIFLMLLTGADSFAAQDPYYDLKRSIGRTLEAELKPEIDRFLTRQMLHPHHPFKMRVYVQLGQENLSEFKGSQDEFGPASFIKAARVNIRLGFPVKDPTLDVHLRAFVLGYFESKGYSSNKRFAGAGSPVIETYIAVSPGVVSTQSEILALLPRLAIASFCLLLLYLLRSSYRDRRPTRHQPAPSTGVVPLQRAVTPTGQQVQIPQAPQPMLPQHPPSEQFNQNYGDPHLRISPHSGSWYINSLSDASIAEIQAAFMRMPFEEVLAVMNSFPLMQRTHVLNSLNLHPAIIQRLQEGMNPTR